MSPSSAPPARGGRLAALVVGLCWLVVFFDGLDMFVYGAELPHMLEHKALGLVPGQAGDLGSYATFGMLIGALSAGTVTDWIGRKKVIITSTAVFSLASALCALAPSLGVFGLGRFIAGLGLGGLLPTTITMVAEYAPRGRGALIVGTLMTAHQAGGIMAGFLGLWTSGPDGWRVAYWICVVPLLVGVPLVARFLPESMRFLLAKGRVEEARALADRYDVELPVAATERPATGNRWSAVAALFRGDLWRTTALFWLASFCGLLLVYGVSNWLPTMMRGAGYELGSSLSFLIVINLGGIVGMLVAGRCSDRYGAARIATVWFACTAVGVHLLGVHMALPLTYTVVFLTGMFLFSAQAMVYAAVAGRSTDANRATAVGWVSGIGRFGAVFGPWLGGRLVASGSEGWGFTAFAVAAVLATVFVALTGLRTSRQPTAAEPAQELSTAG
ncbi:aromatic acid/H+ symport family MFS transporter [Streptomyces sp. WI04-05B]|uniref:MFS transporter n=1 Tax=Streptomyces TaxID=1883 RepID=UPI0029B61E89|nr:MULTISPECIES: aromatic acid/H+ symport family MFS transporter [unclassified Streptomyces]MDX2546009.1 aromatic acid/H+ symport family MFS transporter [Streptomyces sp. WI04-05B]MDX2582690.1 aromatic acid/H+ symport family MFS transporter [Streptomyces sp. WI04-05A]MDX3746995.1 aromatic acid/H+ symport family MFS transporter [Streptomyces sp. AK08-02]